MSSTLAGEFDVRHAGAGYAEPLDSGARLSRALLSYLVVLIAAMSLLPFEFAMPAQIQFNFGFSPLSTIATCAMFMPYGFLTRRSRMGRMGQHRIAIMLSA